MERATRDTDDERLRTMVGRLQETRTRLVSAATTVTAGDDILLVDTTGGSVTVTLPVASTVPGKRVQVKKMIAANTVTVSRSGSDTIDGATTSAFTTQYTCMVYVSCITAAPATWNWIIAS